MNTRKLNRYMYFLAAAMLLICAAIAVNGPARAQSVVTPDSTDIVGGTPAAKGDIPWQVALISYGSNPFYGQFCGGSLVKTNWVVTAAHCVDSGTKPDDLQVVVGIRVLTSASSTGWQRINIKRIVVHPNYNPFTYDNDIALLELSSLATLGTTAGGEVVSLIPLVDENIGTLAGTMSTVSGWGATSYGNYGTDGLMKVQVPIVTNANCNDSNSYNGEITDNMLCAGYDAGGKDSCQGDSGGPLAINTADGWKLAGIVSWGTGCAAPNYFGVYTRVSRYASWAAGYVDVPPIAVPTITSFTPSAAGQGTTVTINGSNLTGATLVKFNGVSAQFSVVSDSVITAVVPALATTGRITVTTPGGTAVSATVFTLLAPPKITSISPMAGVPGRLVTILGRRLRDADVKFNGVVAQKRTNTATKLVVSVPVGATTGFITVTTLGGTATSPKVFTVR